MSKAIREVIDMSFSNVLLDLDLSLARENDSPVLPGTALSGFTKVGRWVTIAERGTV